MNYDVRNQGYWFSQEQLAEHNKKIKADAIEEFYKAYQEKGYYGQFEDWLAEQIKG